MAFRPFGDVIREVCLFLTHLPHRHHRLLVCQTHQPLFGASFRTCHSPWATLRARPAPRLRFFFADVTQFDLTDFAGQKRDLRTMEPVAGKTGHCFVVGERHQLRALHVGLARLCRAGSPKAVVPHRTTGFFFHSCPPTGQLEIVFQGCRPGRQPRHFFCWDEFTLARARQGFYAGQARPGASRAGCAGRPRGCRAGLGI